MPSVNVLDSALHFEEAGDGTPVVLLHGNPGSSHIWRRVMPRLGPGRLLAPDPIGMGCSGKPDIPYTFADHARYLDAWFDALGLDGVVLVGHDWGGALAFDWAARHPERVRGIAFMEAIVKPLSRDELSPQARQRNRQVRTPGTGERMVLEQDIFLRTAFAGGGVLTPVGADDLAAYLAPYPTPESRKPLLAWARQMPLDGEPAEVVARIEAFGAWAAESAGVPKLLTTFHGAPSLLVGDTVAAWCRTAMAALEVVACGPAGHHAPEDRPDEIAAAVAAWLDRHALRGPRPAARTGAHEPGTAD